MRGPCTPLGRRSKTCGRGSLRSAARWPAARAPLISQPEALDGLGKFFVGLGFVADAWTLADPTAAKDDKWDAGLNAAGLAMATEVGSGLVADGLVASGLLAADATIGWVPVVGWALVAGTAAYEAWKHREELAHLAQEAWHGVEWLGDKVSEGEQWVAQQAVQGAENVVHAVGEGLSDAGNAIEGAANAVSDGLSDAGNAVGGFISDHVPHVHLW